MGKGIAAHSDAQWARARERGQCLARIVGTGHPFPPPLPLNAVFGGKG